jgi:aerobic carbon-monoxide dehydrogenase medium subunit
MTTPSNYYRPQTLKDAILKAQLPNTITLAGGALTFGTVTVPYQHVVDIQDLDDLRRITIKDDFLLIGGAVTLQTLVDDNNPPRILRQSITRTLPPNIRNGASVGESLVTTLTPLPEWLAALSALGTTVNHISDGQAQTMPIMQFIEAVHNGDYDGFVTQIEVNLPAANSALGASFVSRTPADRSIINAAAFVTVDDQNTVTTATVVIGGASTAPLIEIELSNLVGNPLDEQNIQHATTPLAALVNPVADYKGSIEYRREMASVCGKRALLDCMEQLS